jgi:hypothetical protein
MNDNGTCEINTTPFEFYTSFLHMAPSWNLYEKGNCGLGRKTATSCLMLVHESGSTWQECRDLCVKGQGDLVKITNEDESVAVSDMLFEMIPNVDIMKWIGLNKVSSDDFIWSDNTQLLYKNFADGEPNTAEDCVAITGMNKYVWKTMNCATKMACICERRNGLS